MSGSWLLAEVSVFWLGLRLIGSLGVILAMIAGLAWVARRPRGMGLGSSRDAIVVRGRQQLGRTTTIALLQVGERALLIGATEQNIEVLAEGDGLLPPEQTMPADDRTSSRTGPDGPVTPGMNMMETLREWSVRRT